MDIKERLIGLLQDGDNPVWCWFPDNAAMVELVDYLLANDVTITQHGRWVDGDPYCPICGKDKFRGLDTDIWSDWKPDFCPNCGARMDKDKEINNGEV